MKCTQSKHSHRTTINKSHKVSSPMGFEPITVRAAGRGVITVQTTAPSTAITPYESQ